MRIRVEDSTWSNVGDGWYMTSLYYMFKRLYPEAVVVMGEGPIQRGFRITKTSQRKNALNIMLYERADIHVISGPFLTSEFFDYYSEEIKNIYEHGEQYVLVSISGTNVSADTRKSVGEFLKKYPPLFFASRDHETYETYKNYVPQAYDGVCAAFLVNKNIPLGSFKMDKPFFISSFYRELEPTYFVDGGSAVDVRTLQLRHHKTKWGLPYDIARHLNFKMEQQEEIGGYRIVRTIQNLNTKFNHINFAMPNSFISFNPVKYLEVVKSSEFTISDRVHACAVSLACGHPARFLFETPRAGIFDRMGFDYKSDSGIMYPNMEKIDEEYDKLTLEIKKYI